MHQDGIRLQKDYPCDIHVFEPVPSFASELQRNWVDVPRSSIHAYGLGASTSFVSGVKVKGQGTFAMEGAHTDKGAKLQIRSIVEVWREFDSPTIDLLSMKCGRLC